MEVFRSRRFMFGRRSSERWCEGEVKRLRELEKENGRLKRLLAERDLELDIVKEFLQKK